MRFEKLNENKIRITLSHDDLVEKEIDFHSFMSNSVESQDLFLDMLDKAEKEIGFTTKDYLIRIEALAMAGGDFVLTVTRSLPKENSKASKKKVHIKRKNIKAEQMNNVIYLFASFEDFCDFSQYYIANFENTNIAKKVVLYNYNDNYYLVLNNINSKFKDLKKLFSSLTEFASFITNSEIFESKLLENGNVIMKHNAILTCSKHFAK